MTTLRAWALLLVLALSPAAQAAGALFHLCGGSVRLNAACCCHPHGGEDLEGPAADASPLSLEDAAAASCCSALHFEAAAPEPAATAQGGEGWKPIPLALVLPALLDLPPPVASEVRLSKRGALDPPRRTQPLFIQHCSFLI